jgi:hypothetical protein
MSKTTPTPLESGSQSEMAEPAPVAEKETETGNQANQKTVITQRAPRDKKLTVEQYLRRAVKDQSIADLIRSLHRTKAMSFAEWEKQTEALLKKKIW